MLKVDEIADQNSCLNKAADDEPVFVLRAHDPLAIGTVLHWIEGAEFVGIHLDKLDDARALVERMRDWQEAQRETKRKCSRCWGEGQIADSEEGEPWSMWESLPPGSDLAVRMGIVQPIPCPACGGNGVAPSKVEG